MDQLNVIAHHLNSIKMNNNSNVVADIYKELWSDHTEWPEPVDELNISKFNRRKTMKEETVEMINAFIKSEWKQLD